MEIKVEVSLNTFQDDMKSNFSYEGSKALFEYLNDLEDDCGIPINYDPIAFRCKYNEYNNLKEVQDDYEGIETIDDLRDKTTVIKIPNSDKLIIKAY